MKPEQCDAAAIKDMLLRGRRAVDRISGLSLNEFLCDQDCQDIVIHCLEIVGEAAARVSHEGREVRPEVPWRQVIAMRNRLIHDYGNVDLEAVWRTTLDDVPALIAALEG